MHRNPFVGTSDAFSNLSILFESVFVAAVPVDILNLDLMNLGVYGNRLSNLTDVEGSVVCSTSEGEHYCNCENHCVTTVVGEPDRCACADGQACCQELLEEFQECIICSDGFEEPNKVGLCNGYRGFCCVFLFNSDVLFTVLFF